MDKKTIGYPNTSGIVVAMRKVVALLLCFSFLFEQGASVQGFENAMFPPPLVAYQPHLRSLAYERTSDILRLLVDSGDYRGNDKDNARDQAAELLRFFLIAVSLPNNSYWVNLRPDAEDQMLDSDMAKTDAGRIMLAADLELKSELGRLTSPYTDSGKQYWQALYRKAGEIFGGVGSDAPVSMRVWIVPGEIIIRESGQSAYIYKATLNVLNENEYLNQNYYYDDIRVKRFNDFALSLFNARIMPQLVKAVNTSDRYAALRQLYYSFILAQWFKSRFRGTFVRHSEFIDTRCLAGLRSQRPWDKKYYFKEYRKSYQRGEYNSSEVVFGLEGQAVRNYFFGGISLGLSMPASPKPGTSVTEGSVTIIGGRPLIPVISGDPALGIEFRGDRVIVNDNNIGKTVSSTISHTGAPVSTPLPSRPFTPGLTTFSHAPATATPAPSLGARLSAAAQGQLQGFSIDRLFQQFGQLAGNAGAFLSNTIQRYPGLSATAIFISILGIYSLFRWVKDKKDSRNTAGAHKWIYRSAKHVDRVVTRRPHPQRTNNQESRNNWEYSVSAVLQELKSAVAEAPESSAGYLVCLDKARKLTAMLPFEAGFVTEHRTKYYEIYGEAISQLYTALESLMAEIRVAADSSNRRQLKIYAEDFLLMIEYLDECQHTLHAVENIPMSSGDRFDRRTLAGRMLAAIVGAVFGFNRNFKDSTRRLREQLTGKIIPLGNRIDNLYSEDSGIADRVIEDWDNWVEDCYHGKKVRLGARKGWIWFREMLSPFIAVVLLISLPGTIINGIASVLAAADQAARGQAVLGLTKSLSGLVPLVFSWYALQVTGKKDTPHNRNIFRISKLKKELNAIAPSLSGGLKDKALNDAYLNSLESLSKELRLEAASAEAVIVVSDQKEKMRRFLDSIKGTLLRDDVSIVCIRADTKGSASSFIEGMLEAQRFRRAIVLLGRGRDVDTALNPLPLPEVPGLGRSLTPLELALISGYQVTQALQDKNRNGIAAEFAHKCSIADKKALLESRILGDIELFGSWVGSEQMEKQDLGLLVTNGNSNGRKKKGAANHLVKLFQHVGAQKVKDKFAPRYLSSFLFDWRNQERRQMSVFGGGMAISIDDSGRYQSFMSLLSRLKGYLAEHADSGFQVSLTTHLLVPLIMLANGEGKDIHRFLETQKLGSKEEWDFFDGLFDIYWPHFSSKAKDSNLENLKMNTLIPYQPGSLYVRLDGTSYARQLLKNGLGSLYTEPSVFREEGKLVGVAVLRHQHSLTRKPRTTFDAPKRRFMLRDFFSGQNHAEFTIRDTLEQLYSAVDEYEIQPSYSTVYRDLEMVTGEGFLIKDKKYDPTSHRYKNFYRLSKIGAVLAEVGQKAPGAETAGPVSSGKETMPPFLQHDGRAPLQGGAVLPGGIDLRTLPITILKDDGNGVSGEVPLSPLRQDYDNDFKVLWSQVQEVIKKGDLPQTSKVKECYELARMSRFRGELLAKVRSGVAEILRIEERMVIVTKPELREILVLLEASPDAGGRS
ncbi:MAG: hypothetical protein WC469_01660 [Candidatus Omnitrophota bacterium]